jgi:hypothetical protein
LKGKGTQNLRSGTRPEKVSMSSFLFFFFSDTTRIKESNIYPPIKISGAIHNPDGEISGAIHPRKGGKPLAHSSSGVADGFLSEYAQSGSVPHMDLPYKGVKLLIFRRYGTGT